MGAGKSAPVIQVLPSPAASPFGSSRVLSAAVTATPDGKPWDSMLRQPILQAVKKDDIIAVRVWLRSSAGQHVGVFVEEETDPYTKVAEQSALTTEQWKEVRFIGKARRDYAQGALQLSFHLAYQSGTVEIADVRVDDFGKGSPLVILSSIGGSTVDYWEGQAHPDTWRKAALDRIEKLRKRDLTVRVVNASGKPVSGAAVSVEMTRHAFRFGNILRNPEVALVDTPDNIRMRDTIKQNYNTITFEGDMKWPNLADWHRGPRVHEAIDWLHQNGIDVRGHNLVWGSFRYMPKGMKDLSDDDLVAAVHKHVTDTVADFKGQVYIWDVVNEAATNTELWDRIGWENFANAYKWAREADPNVLLCYNDYNIANESPDGGKQRKLVEQRIQYLLDHGAPLDVISDQAHMGAPLTPIHRVLQIWDEMAKFGKPLEITEFDASIPDDKVQGDYVRDFLTAAFSQPAVTAFVQWGFWEGSHWMAANGAPLYRLDWSKRPSELAYEDLVLHQWWTRASGKTDGKGDYHTRGFMGDYKVAVTRGGVTKTVDAKLLKDSTITVTL